MHSRKVFSFNLYYFITVLTFTLSFFFLSKLQLNQP